MDFIRKTLGGLKASYYIRHFVFGALISTFFIYMSMQNPGGVKVENIIFFLSMRYSTLTQGLYMSKSLGSSWVKMSFSSTS